MTSQDFRKNLRIWAEAKNLVQKKWTENLLQELNCYIGLHPICFCHQKKVIH